MATDAYAICYIEKAHDVYDGPGWDDVSSIEEFGLYDPVHMVEKTEIPISEGYGKPRTVVIPVFRLTDESDGESDWPDSGIDTPALSRTVSPFTYVFSASSSRASSPGHSLQTAIHEGKKANRAAITVSALHTFASKYTSVNRTTALEYPAPARKNRATVLRKSPAFSTGSAGTSAASSRAPSRERGRPRDRTVNGVASQTYVTKGSLPTYDGKTNQWLVGCGSTTTTISYARRAPVFFLDEE